MTSSQLKEAYKHVPACGIRILALLLLLLMPCGTVAGNSHEAQPRSSARKALQDANARRRLLQQDAPQTGYVVAWGNLRFVGTPPITTRAGIVKIAAGWRHAMALTSAGKVILWGDHEFNQTRAPADALKDVVDIAAGWNHSLVLLRNGSVVAWANNTDGVCDVPDDLRNGSVKVTALAAGPNVSLAVADGGVRAWGANTSGQLTVPAEASSNVTAISAGASTMLALRSDKTLVAWGYAIPVPDDVQKNLLGGPHTISSGWSHVVAVLGNGSIAAWKAGENPIWSIVLGQVAVSPEKGTYTAVAAGTNFTMALTSQGEVVTWGVDDGSGVLSVPAAARSNVIAVSIKGEYFCLALVAGSYNTSPASTPVASAAPVPGHVIKWGQVDDVPAAAYSGGVLKVSTGFNHMLALLEDGSWVQWGFTTRGHTVDPPTDLKRDIVDIATGAYHNLVLLRDGSVRAWGYNDVNQCNIPDFGNVKVKSIAAGWYFSLALLENGTVVTWGDELQGELLVPAAAKANVTGIAAWEQHSMAVKTDDSLVHWGKVVTFPDIVTEKALRTNPLSISAERWHYLAILKDGSIAAWRTPDGGDRDATEIDQILSAPAGRARSVSASFDVSAAVMESGDLNMWGAPSIAMVLGQAPRSHVIAAVAREEGGYMLVADLSPHTGPAGLVSAWGPRVPRRQGHDGQFVVKVSTGSRGIAGYVMELMANGTVRVWGDSTVAYLFDTNRVAGQVVVDIAAGPDYWLALLRNGSLVAWGNAPALPRLSGARIQAIAAGDTHALLLLSNGSVVAFGGNDLGESTVPSTIDGKVRAIAAGPASSFALVHNSTFENGTTLVAWGKAGEIPAAAQQNATAVSAAGRQVIALLQDGTVTAWLSSPSLNSTEDKLVTTVPDGLRNVKSIAAADTHSVALLASGQVVTWGLGDVDELTGQGNLLTVPWTVNREAVVGVATGLQFTVAILDVPSIRQLYQAPGCNAALNSLGYFCTRVLDALPGDWQLSYTLSFSAVPPSNACTRPYVTSNNTPTLPAGATHWAHFMLSSTAGGWIAVSYPDDMGRMYPAKAILGYATGEGTAANTYHLTQRALPSPDVASWAINMGVTTSSEGRTMLCFSQPAVLPSNYTGNVSSRHSNRQLLQGDDTFILDLTRELRIHLASSPSRDVTQMHTVVGTADINLTSGNQNVAALQADVQSLSGGRARLNRGALAGIVIGAVAAVAAACGLFVYWLRSRNKTPFWAAANKAVFKCIWPNRFGPNALLAAKVVKDGFDTDMRALESFTYEANVLASTQHPNIVRLYGYCLEPPTLCLILELLPTSLKDVLYKGISYPFATGSYQASKSTKGVPSDTSRTESHGLTSSQKASSQTWSTQSTQPSSATGIYSSRGQGSVHIDIPISDATVELQVSPPVEGAANAEPEITTELLSTTQSSSTRTSQLTCLQVVCLATDMAAGLTYLHNGDVSMLTEATDEEQPIMVDDNAAGISIGRSKIVHRDMKPANILINSKGVAKISDFGLARQHEHTSVATMHLGVGTLPYMAPELLVGAQAGTYGQSATNRVDIYSLAMMMWEMLSGCPPWKDMGEMAILAAVSRKQRPPLPAGLAFKDAAALLDVAGKTATPAAIPQLNQLIRACWHQRDLKRPQAKEVYAKLMDMLALMQRPAAPAAPTSVAKEEGP